MLSKGFIVAFLIFWSADVLQSKKNEKNKESDLIKSSMTVNQYY